MDAHALTATFAHVTLDWALFAAIAVLAFFDALRSTPSRVASLALALPLALFIQALFTHAALVAPILEKYTAPAIQALIFAVIFILSFILTRRITSTYGSSTGGLLQSVVSGICLAILVAIVWLNVPALVTLHPLNAQLIAVFGGGYSFWWVLGSFGALAFVKK